MRKFFFNENNMMIAIGINAIVIFCLSFPELSQSLFWIILDDIFIAFFLVEAVIKIKALKFKNYWKDKWNKFDFIVAVGSLPLLFPKLLELMAAQGIDPFIIVMLRLFRLLRLVKFFWFVPNLAHLLRGLSRAFKASIFVLIILLFFNFILSILTTHLYGKIAPDLFRTPFHSFYTIFQLFTLEGWNEIPQAIAETTDNNTTIFLTRMYFAFIVLIGGIFGMSLANAIFVDEMTLDNNEVVEEKLDKLEIQIQELKALLVKNNEKNETENNSMTDE